MAGTAEKTNLVLHLRRMTRSAGIPLANLPLVWLVTGLAGRRGMGAFRVRTRCGVTGLAGDIREDQFMGFVAGRAFELHWGIGRPVYRLNGACLVTVQACLARRMELFLR